MIIKIVEKFLQYYNLFSHLFYIAEEKEKLETKLLIKCVWQVIVLHWGKIALQSFRNHLEIIESFSGFLSRGVPVYRDLNNENRS